MHLVDVIIPTHNRLDQTIEAVESVRVQTDPRWHLYLVDDASDDGSFEALRTRFGDDARITLIRRERVGRAARARQTGFEAGSAEWVATLDSDDVWISDKLQSQLAMTDGHDVVLGWHSWMKPDGSVRVTRKPMGEGRVSPLLSSNVDVVLMRRDLVHRIGGFWGSRVPELLADENIEFFIRLLSEGRVAVVPGVVALCRDHVGSRTSDSMTPESLATIVDLHRAALDGDPEFGALLCRLGGRYLASGQRETGLRHLREGIRRSAWRRRLELTREYAPLVARSLPTRSVDNRTRRGQDDSPAFGHEDKAFGSTDPT